MNTAILDVAIGLMMTFLIMSMIATVVQELISNILNLRAKTLKSGLNQLLSDPNTQDLVDAVYKTPAVRSLSTKKNHGPSHIPSARFAEGLLDALEQRGGLSAAATGPLTPLVKKAEGDVEAFKKEASVWFNEAMEGVSAVYKAKAQTILLLIGFAIAAIFNVSTISIGQALWTQPTLRDAVVAQTQAYASQHADELPTAESIRNLQESLDSMGLPIGWTDDRLALLGLAEPAKPVASMTKADDAAIATMPPPPTSFKDWLLDFGAMLLGWVLTALATSLGSQFWFDTLGKTLAVRAALSRQVQNAGGSKAFADSQPSVPASAFPSAAPPGSAGR